MVELSEISTTLIRLMERAGCAANLDEPGDVIQCPPSALRTGKFYVMGFNPGSSGGKDGKPRSLRETTQGLAAYHEKQEHPLGKWRAWHKLESLTRKLDVTDWQENLFITNLFPNASGGVAGWLRSHGRRGNHNAAVQQIWPVHQYLLSIVRPRFVIVHGQAARDSAFRYLWELLVQKECPQADWNATIADETRKDDPSIKSFQLPSLDLGNWGELPAITFIGIKHLSYPPSDFDVMAKGLIRN